MVRGKARGARMEEAEVFGAKALRRSVKERRVGAVERVDTNKGTEENPKVRCFPVTRNF